MKSRLRPLLLLSTLKSWKPRWGSRQTYDFALCEESSLQYYCGFSRQMYLFFSSSFDKDFMSKGLDEGRHLKKKKRKCIPVHAIASQLDGNVLTSLPAFHSLTGSDTTSFLVGHSKKICWNICKANHQLLPLLGWGDLTAQARADAEQFICNLYKVDTTRSVNITRSILFAQSRTPEILPPTKDSLSFHIKRAHYQASVWYQTDRQQPVLSLPETTGWKIENGNFIPTLMSLSSAPESFITLITCSCTTQL